MMMMMIRYGLKYSVTLLSLTLHVLSLDPQRAPNLQETFKHAVPWVRYLTTFQTQLSIFAGQVSIIVAHTFVVLLF